MKLIPKTHKAKNRINEARAFSPSWDGIAWGIIKQADTVIFSDKCGPWLFVAPVGCEAVDKVSRWVNQSNDVDFTVDFTI